MTQTLHPEVATHILTRRPAFRVSRYHRQSNLKIETLDRRENIVVNESLIFKASIFNIDQTVTMLFRMPLIVFACQRVLDRQPSDVPSNSYNLFNKDGHGEQKNCVHL